MILVAVLAVTACGDSDDDDGAVAEGASTTTTSGSEPTRQPLRPTYPASECCEQAGLHGGEGLTLAGDPSTGCVWFEGVGSDARVSIIWPEGFTVSFDPLRIYDLDGAVFAEEGQTYTGLGGSAESDDPPAMCSQDPSASVASWRIGEVALAP
jgi:hypothetical protein